MKFAYSGFTLSGSPASGVIDAEDRAAAEAQLRAQQIFVSTLDSSGKTAAPSTTSRSRHVKSSAVKQTSRFMRQLALLATAGTPLVDALAATERQSQDDDFRGVLHDIRVDVEQGSTLADAMEKHPHKFDPIARSLVRAGESGAKLPDMLMHLATILERQSQLNATLRGSMIYPAFLITICSTVLIGMVTTVLPRFAEMFENLSAPLPLSTRMLMGLSDMLREYWYAWIIGVVAVVGGAIWHLRTPAGVRSMHATVLRLPGFGPLIRSFITARVARVLGILLHNKVALTDALAVALDTAGNVYVRERMGPIISSVEQGDGLAKPLRATDMFDPSFCELVQTGEDSGRLGDVLTHAADFMDQENETAARSLSKLLEPIIMIGMGLLVGGIAISIFLPMFDLTATAGR